MLKRVLRRVEEDDDDAAGVETILLTIGKGAALVPPGREVEDEEAISMAGRRCWLNECWQQPEGIKVRPAEARDSSTLNRSLGPSRRTSLQASGASTQPLGGHIPIYICELMRGTFRISSFSCTISGGEK